MGKKTMKTINPINLKYGRITFEKRWYFLVFYSFFDGNWRNIGSSTWDLTEYDGDRENQAWKIAKETWMFSKIFIGDMGWDIYIYIHI